MSNNINMFSPAAVIFTDICHWENCCDCDCTINISSVYPAFFLSVKIVVIVSILIGIAVPLP